MQVDSPGTGITDYVRDAAGNVTQRTDARSVVTDYSYDALNRLSAEDYPATPADDVAYTYDATAGGNEGVGRLTSVSDVSGSSALTYDHRGNVISDARTIETQSYTTGYAYDLSDRVTEITYPSGRIVLCTRDTLGRVTKVSTKETLLSTEVTVAETLAYDPFGPLVELDHGNGLELTRSYDLDGRLTDILTTDGLTPVQDLDYGYDDADGVTSITDNLASARSESFGYDALRRLSDADGLYGDIDYAYDAVGNRTSRAIFDGLITITDTYTIASTSNRLVSTTDGSTTRSFTYDAMGSVSQDDRGVGTPYDLTHNDEGRLVEIAQGLTSLATYKHNAFGQRVVKTAGATTTHYHYDLSGRLIAESDGSGTVQREFIHLGSLSLAVVDHSVGGGPALYHVHADQLGTPRRMTDGTKAIVWDAVFRPFGEVESLTGTATNDNRFQGQRLDAVAGFHYNYFRDYDPRLGRYIQSDPIGLAGGINTYAYAHSDPTNLTDPTGLVAPVVLPLVVGCLVDPACAVPVIAGIGYLCQQAVQQSGIGDKLFNEGQDENGEPGGEEGESEPPVGIEEVLKGATPGRETKGRTKQWEKSGGLDQANEDFDSLKPENVQPLPGGGRTGTLTDESRATVYPDSSDGRPTVEIQSGKNRTKIRYND